MSDRATRIELYRTKAEELRAVAESIKDPEIKKMLMGVAADYLSLADRLERSQMQDPFAPLKL
jgi:hypothetical protein